jgi:hypothetical protein
MTATLQAEVSKLAPKLSGNLKVNQKKQAVNNLVATLFNTVRMSDWEFDHAEVAYKFPLNKKLALWLTTTSVEVRKGIRKFPIGNGKDAARLFTNIQHAQAVIAKSVAEQDKQVTAFMEAFDIDAELAGDDVVSANSEKVDIRIKPAPASVAPAETSEESETVAALLADEDKEDVLSKIATAETALKALQAEVDEDDPTESDIFADVLGCSEAKAANDAKVYGDAGTSVVDAFAPEEPKGCLPQGWGARALDIRRADINRQRESLKSLQGRVLGIVDASFSDKEQRAAVKTLINKEFRREMDKFGGTNGVVSDEN